MCPPDVPPGCLAVLRYLAGLVRASKTLAAWQPWSGSLLSQHFSGRGGPGGCRHSQQNIVSPVLAGQNPSRNLSLQNVSDSSTCCSLASTHPLDLAARHSTTGLRISMTMDGNSPSADTTFSDGNGDFTSSDLSLNLGAGFGDLDTPLGFADQACKECRRRKSKCNKAIPTCNLCVKYRRHCLYEKHSRTPLTRKWVLCVLLIVNPVQYHPPGPALSCLASHLTQLCTQSHH